MRRKRTKVLLTDGEMAMTIEALKLFRQAVVANSAVEFFSKEQKSLLADIRVDIETLTDKLDTAWRGK